VEDLKVLEGNTGGRALALSLEQGDDAMGEILILRAMLTSSREAAYRLIEFLTAEHAAAVAETMNLRLALEQKELDREYKESKQLASDFFRNFPEAAQWMNKLRMKQEKY
jgi:hypothetical protein